jgi:hypothetical protein
MVKEVFLLSKRLTFRIILWFWLRYGILHLLRTKTLSNHKDSNFIKRTLLFLIPLFCSLLLQAQPKIKVKKYPSLLWEITGNGLKKPSYLIGTMHVSSKLAFHLTDSFYIAIRSADIVAGILLPALPKQNLKWMNPLINNLTKN